MEDKTKQWKDLEEYFATEVIEQSKRTAKRWFVIWLITFIALVATNTVWIYLFNSYEYVQTGRNEEKRILPQEEAEKVRQSWKKQSMQAMIQKY